MKLNKMEQELLLLLANEDTMEEISVKLGMKVEKVNQLVKNMILKFEAKTEVGLIKEAIKEGYIKND